MSKELFIRKAMKEDVPTILALLMDDDLSKLHEDGDLDVYENAFRALSRDANQILAVTVLNSKIVGCLQITFIPGLSRKGMWRAQIEGVRIARSLRGHGLGTDMIEWAIAQCKERGCGLMQLLADKSRTQAHRFYESLASRQTTRDSGSICNGKRKNRERKHCLATGTAHTAHAGGRA